MPPYKKQVIADDVPQLKPFDYTKQLNAIADNMNHLSQKTAEMAKVNFLNTFEVESRKALGEAYERNMNNPKQLEEEQGKIQLKFLSALPTKEMREEAKMRFTIHAMGDLGKAKENLYNQEYKQLQASTLDKTNVITNDIRNLGKSLYEDNLSVSGTAANAIGADITELNKLAAVRDARGNFVMSPEKQASIKDNIRMQLTLADMDYFNGLETLEAKEKFYNAYKNKETKKMWLDADNPQGYSQQGMTSNNTDWPTYEKNLAAMERQLEVTKQENLKGLGEQEKLQFAVNKIKVLENLDVLREQMKPEDGDMANPYRVLSFLQQINDLTTNSQTAYVGQDGRIAYYLNPEEAYKYKSDVLKNYWSDMMKALEKQPDKTYFSLGLETINTFFDKNQYLDKLNDFDKMDIMQEYYRQLSKSIPVDQMQNRANLAYADGTRRAAQQAIQSFVLSSKKFSDYEKNMIATTPAEIKTKTINWQEELGSLADAQHFL